MREALELTPSQIMWGIDSLTRLRASSEETAAERGDGPDMSRPTATAADLRGLVSI